MSTPGRDDSDGWDENDDLMDVDAPDVLSDDRDEDEILSPDPDEYSDEPHMGSVPRLLGEEEYLPETQGEDPLYAELGDEGQGDLAPEDR